LGLFVIEGNIDAASKGEIEDEMTMAWRGRREAIGERTLAAKHNYSIEHHTSQLTSQGGTTIETATN